MAGQLAMQAIFAILLLGSVGTTHGAFFTWRTVLQDNCFAGEQNTITVVLKSDTTLDRDTAISIRGLHKAIVADHDNVPLSGDHGHLFSNGGCGTKDSSRAIWRDTDEEGDAYALIFWPREPLTANTNYTFNFMVTNPEEEQMPGEGGTPEVTIEASGGVGIARVPVWTMTQLTEEDSLVLADTERCLPPAGGANPEAHIADTHLYRSTVSRMVNLATTARMPQSFQFQVAQCNGEQGVLYADGVQGVTVAGVTECGCTASSGELQVLDGNGNPDGKFSATFHIQYKCVNAGGHVGAGPFNDTESCRMACQGPSPQNPGITHVCISDTPTVTIENPGWGYSSPPTLSVVGDPGCDLQFEAHLAEGSGFAATYEVTQYECTCDGNTVALPPDECPAPGGCAACVGNAVATVTSRGEGFNGAAVQLQRISSNDQLCVLADGSDLIVTPSGEDRLLSGGRIPSVGMCSRENFDACYHAVPEVTVTQWTGCDGVFTVQTVTPKINSCDSEYGDAYPMKIRGYSFVQKRIRQSTTFPGALNTMTVSLVTAFRLQSDAIIHIEGMDNAGLDDGDVALTFVTANPGYDAHATWICPSTLQIKSNGVAPGACAVFTFRAHNNRPDEEQSATPVQIKVENNGDRNMGLEPMEMGDHDLTGTELAHSQPFHVLPAQFTECRVWQLEAYPRQPSAEYKTSDGTLRIGGLGTEITRENTLYFKFATNFDIEVTTFVEISGLEGIRTESSIRDFEVAGEADFFRSVFCSKRHADVSGQCQGNLREFKWDEDTKTMTFYPNSRIPAGTSIELHAKMEMTELDNPEIFISTVQHRASFDSDTVIFAGLEVEKKQMELGLDDAAACPSSMWNQKREETIPFSSRNPSFYLHTIQQATPYLEETNTITVSLALNVPLFPDSTITMRADHAKWVDTGFTVIRGATHSPQFLLTIEPDSPLELKAQVSESAGVMVPGWSYTLQVTSVTNPDYDEYVSSMAVRTASQVKLSLDVPELGPLDMVKPVTADSGCRKADDLHPFRYLDPTKFCTYFIEQTSSTPLAANQITLKLATYFHFDQAIFRLSSWPTDLGTASISPVGFAHNFTGRVSTIGPVSMTAGQEYSYTFSLTNWAHTALTQDANSRYLNRDPTIFNLALLNGGVLRIPDTPLDTVVEDMPAASSCPEDKRPLRILAPGLCSCSISSASAVLPDRDNVLTVTFITTVDVPSAAISSSTVWTLTQTDSGPAWEASTNPIPSYVNYVSYDPTNKEMKFNNVTVDLAQSLDTSFTYTAKAPLTAQSQMPTFSLGIANFGTISCDSTLVVLKPTFTVAKIGQVNPYPLATNNIIVTVQANYKPAGDWYMHLELTNIENPNDVILDVDGNENTRGNVNIEVPGVPDCSAAISACSSSGAGNLSAFVDPEAEAGVFVARRGRFQLDTPNRKASIWFKVTDLFEVETPYVFFFELQNPPKARQSMSVYVTAERQYLVTPNQNPHIERTEVREGTGLFFDNCDGVQIFEPTPQDSLPLFVRQPVLVESSICQSSAFPSTDNTIDVSIVMNTAIPRGTTVTVSGFRGLFRTEEDTQLQIRDIEGPVVAVGRRDVVGEGLELTFRVKDEARPTDGSARGIHFRFTTENPASAQSHASPQVSMNGQVQISLVRTMLGECAVPDRRVLYIVEPEFTRRVVSQKIPYPGAINTLYFTIESNVPLVSTTQFTISGLIAQPSDFSAAEGLDFAELEGGGPSATLVPALCVREEGTGGLTVKGVNEQSNIDVVGSVTGDRRRCGISGRAGCEELQMQFGITGENPEFTPIRFAIRVVNPTKVQSAPTIYLASNEGTQIARIEMLSDRTTCDDCTRAENSDALMIVEAAFRSASIVQTNPWPLGENYLIITFDAGVALEPGTIVTVSGFPEREFKAGDTLSYDSNSVAALRIDETVVTARGDGCLDGDVTDRNGRDFDAKYPANCGKVDDDVIITDPGDSFGLGNSLVADFSRCEVAQPTAIDVTYTRDVFTVSRNVANGELLFTVKDDTRTTRCSPLVIKIPVDNPVNNNNDDVNTGQWTVPTAMTIVATKGTADRGVNVAARSVLIDPNNVIDHFTICGRDVTCPSNRTIEATVGDAVPLKLYSPSFVMWTMEQSMPYPDACNVITVRFKTNVNIPADTDVDMTFSMSEPTAVETHPVAPSAGGYSEAADVNTNTAPKLVGTSCVGMGNSFYECEIDKALPGIVSGDYIRSYSGLVQETDFVPISSIFKVVSIDGLKLRLLADADEIDFKAPEDGNYFAKVIYIKPMVGDRGEVFDRAAWLDSTRSTGWDQVVMKLKTTRTVLSGTEYAFQFTVRNAIPSSDTAGVSKVEVSTSFTVSAQTVTFDTKEATFDRTSVILQEEAKMDNMWSTTLTEVLKAVTEVDTVIRVSGDMPLHFFGPGIHVQIDDEVMMLVHHGNHSLMVRRGQLGTEPAEHQGGSHVRPVLPGSMPGDKVPFAVHSQRMVLNFGRQTNPLPGKFNRHQYTMAANFPLNKMHLLSVDPLHGATPAPGFGMLEPPCLRTDDLDIVRRCSSLESNVSDFFPDVMMPVYDVAASSGSFNDMAMVLKLSAVSDRLRIFTTLPNITYFNITINNITYPNVSRSVYFPDWQGTELTFPLFADNLTHCWDTIPGYTGSRPKPDFQAGDLLRINDEVVYVIADCMLLRGVRGTTVANHSHDSVMFSIKEEGSGVFFGGCPAPGPARNVLPPGHLYQFTYAVLNPTSSNRDRQNAVQTKTNLTFAPDGFESVAVITYDNASLPLGDSGHFGALGDLQLMEVYGKTFIDTQVGQSNANPGHANNEICVTLRPSFTVPADAAGRTMYNLSGFTNGVHEDGDISIRSPNIPNPFPSTGTWRQAESSVIFHLSPAHGLQAGRQYEMCFSLTNPPDEQEAQTISLHSTGEVQSVSIKAKNFTDCKCVEGWYKLGGVDGTGGGGSGFSAYVRVYDDNREPEFAFLDQSLLTEPSGRLPPNRGSKYMATPTVEFTACSAIGTDNGAIPDTQTGGNDCNCECKAADMFAVNVHGITGVEGVLIQCSEHVDWDDTVEMAIAEGGTGSGFHAKFEATNSTGRSTNRLVIQHHGDQYLYTPYSENSADSDCACSVRGDPSGGASCRCNGPKIKLAGRYASLCNITVDAVVVSGSMVIESHQLKNAEGDHAPLVVHKPMWITTVIAQASPWPGAYNEMTITLKSNAAFESGSVITIAGFNTMATPDAQTAGGPPIYDYYTPPSTNVEFRPEKTQNLRTVYTWVDGTLTFSVKQRWEDEKELKLHFRVNNPDDDLFSPDQYPQIDYSSFPTIEISRPEDATVAYIAQQPMVTFNVSQGGIAGAQQPLRIYTDTWTQCRQESQRSIKFWEVGRSCHYETAHSHPPGFAHEAEEICTEPIENGIVPVVGMTRVGQSECRPSMMNTITVTIVSNVPLGQKCAMPCLEGAAITIVGIKGGTIEVIEAGRNPEQTRIFNGGDDSDAAGEDSVFGGRAVVPSSDEILDSDDEDVQAIHVEVQSSEVVIPGRMHVFSFEVMNGPDEQLAAAIPKFTMRVNGNGLLDGYSPLHNGGDNDKYGAACYGAGTCKNVRLSPALYMEKDDDRESNLPMRIHGIPEVLDFKINFPGDLVAGDPVSVEIEFSVNQYVRLRTGRVLEVNLARFETASALTVSDNKGLFGGASFNTGTDVLSLTVGTPPTPPSPLSEGQVVLDGKDDSSTIAITVTGMRLPREGNIENNPRFNFASDPFSAEHGECLDGWIPNTGTPDTLPVGESGPPVGWLQTTSLDWMTMVPAGEPNAGEENRIAGREAKIVATFRLWMDLAPSDSIVFTLPGFTGADSNGDTEDGGWEFEWKEGDEEVTFKPKAAVDVAAIEEGEAVGDFPVGRDFTLVVPQSGGITVPESGVPEVQDPPFMVRSDAAAGPVLPIRVDSHQPVYRYRCRIGTVTASLTNQGYCDGTWAIQMCAMNAGALQTYITANSLTGEDGYVAASGQEVTIGGETTRSGTPLSTCGGEIDAQCKAIGGSPELQSVTFLSYAGERQKKNLCCKHSHEVATVGLGNLATCLTDDDCINIEAGRGSLDPQGTSVAVFESEFHICCEWCYEYYGTIACGASDFTPRGKDNADIRTFCEVEQQCRATAPCYGHHLEATADPPSTSAGGNGDDLEIVTLKGDGVTIKNGDLPVELKAPISVYEVKTEQLSSTARGQIGGENGLKLAGSILEFGPSGTRFNNPIAIEIQVEDVEGASWELGPPPRTAVPASGPECCDCERNSCSGAQGTCTQPGANSNRNCAAFSCNDYCSGEIAAGNAPAPGATVSRATTAAAAAAAAATTTTATTTTPAPRRLLEWAATGNMRHLLQENAPPKGDGEDYLIFKLVDETWKVVAPAQLKSVRNDVGEQVWKVRTLISSFSVYAPFFAKYPEVPPISKYWTTAGDEVYLTVAAAVFLLLLAWLIIILPCFRRERTLPPLPPQPPAAPPPVPFLPPPPPMAPVFVTDVAPHTRYNTQGAPIKHFGPDMPGAQFEAGREGGQVEDEFLHGVENPEGMLGYPYSDARQVDPYHLDEGVSYMPPTPMFGPPLPDLGPMGASVAPQAFSAAPSYPYGQSAVPQHSVAPQYPGYPGQPFL